MARTKVVSKTNSSFLQPAIGGTVDIVADPMIDWLTVGARVHVLGGGIYEVTANTMYVWTFRLETAEVAESTLVRADTFYPVSQQNSMELMWGGAGKEW